MDGMDFKESLLIRVMIVVALPVVASMFGHFSHNSMATNVVPTAAIVGGIFSATVVTLGCQYVLVSISRVMRTAGLLAGWLLLTQLLFLGMEQRFSYGIWFFLVGIWFAVGILVGIVVDSIIHWEAGSANWRFSLAELLLWMVVVAVVLKVVRIPFGVLLRDVGLTAVIALFTTFVAAWLARSTSVGWSLLALAFLSVAVAAEWYWFRLAPDGFSEYTVVHSITLYILLRWVAPLPGSAARPRCVSTGSCDATEGSFHEVPPDA